MDDIEWDKCKYCQSLDCEDALICPALNSTHHNKQTGYSSVIHDLEELESLKEFIPFELSEADNDDDLARILHTSKSKCHCHNKYGSKSIMRTEKRRQKEESCDAPEAKLTRSKYSDRFKTHVTEMKKKLIEKGNPFTEERKDLVAVHTQDVASKAVVDTIHSVKSISEEKYLEFSNGCFVEQTRQLYDRITQNKLPLFSSPVVKESSRTDEKVKSLENDRNLFSSLYIACQHRDGELDEILQVRKLRSTSIYHCNG